MKKQINRKPVASFDYETGEFSSGTDVSKLRAMIFNQKPEYHNEMLDLIKSRMTAGEVLQLIDHMDRNPSQVRLFQQLSRLLDSRFDPELLINLVNEYLVALINQNDHYEEWRQKVELARKVEEHDREAAIQRLGEEIIAELNNPEPDVPTAKDISDHYEIFYERETEEMVIKQVKTHQTITSTRLLLELFNKFKQGTPIDECEDILLTGSKQIKKDIINYKAKLQESSLQLIEMMRHPVNTWDFNCHKE